MQYVLDALRSFDVSGWSPPKESVSRALSYQVPTISGSDMASLLQSQEKLLSNIWNAVSDRRASIIMDGIEIANPTLATLGPSDTALAVLPRVFGTHQSPDRPQPLIVLNSPAALQHKQSKASFAVEGEVSSIFGVSGLTGKYERLHNDDKSKVAEKVTLNEDLHISLVLPELEGSVFDDITFKNVVFYHQNYADDETLALGWHIMADWIIDSSCGALYDILTKVLGVTEPTIYLHAGLGYSQDWKKPLSVHSFTLEGVLPGFKLSLVDHIHFASLGVRLLGIRGFETSPEPHSTLSFGFGIFGELFLDVPGSVVPLHLNYEIGLLGKTIQVTATVVGDSWFDPFGIIGLKVSVRLT